MHIHILSKVWEQKTGDWDMHTGAYRGIHVCAHLCKGMELMWGVKWTCTHVVVMHMHIQAKVLKRGY